MFGGGRVNIRDTSFRFLPLCIPTARNVGLWRNHAAYNHCINAQLLQFALKNAVITATNLRRFFNIRKKCPEMLLFDEK